MSIDLSKAFDTVSHEILIRKMFAYGIRGLPLLWFRSYLHNRTQVIRVGSAESKSRCVTCGVPQGSVIGPILFLIYINDLPQISNSAHFTLFADDTTLTCSKSNYSDLIVDTNTNLALLYEWTVNNRLSLNANKTSVLLFSNRISDVISPLLLVVNDVPVFCENSVKFLGVSIDRRLSFADHINSICTKISKTIGIFYRIRFNIPESVLINLYYSLVYPYLIYGVLLWGDASLIHLHPLIILQKKVLRVITSSHYLAHTEPLFQKTKILRLNDIYSYILGIHMY